jgi:hypothetical protein
MSKSFGLFGTTELLSGLLTNCMMIPATGSYGNENWEFDEHGFMRWRIASINDLPIQESDVCPDDHPGLSDLNL